MRTDEVMQVLLRKYPNGVSFTPMALRLLRQKVPLKDSQIQGLKAKMFQLGDGLWFFRDMIADEKDQLEIRRQATAWLNEQGCFSAERLFDGFRGSLRHVSTLKHFAAFLRHLGFPVAAWKRGVFFCFQPPPGLDERLAEGSKAIVEQLEEAGGTLALAAIQDAMSHLTADALEGIRVQFLPEVHLTEIGGHPCWCSTDAIPLPEDFAEKLTAAVDTLVTLGKKVSAANIEFALSLAYRIRFREVYVLPDNRAFMRVCAKHYQGANDVFPSATRPRRPQGDVSLTAKRTRSANTCFRSLGVPIGAKLVFTKDEPPPTAARRAEHDIIGLEGWPLHPATWRAFKTAGTSPRVAEWARRVEKGETVESIARESGLMASTVNEYIKNRRRYLLVSESNGISPETGVDV